MIYPINKMWRRKFWPHIPDVQNTLRRAIRTIRYDYDPAIHIPREAGYTIDYPWPRTRECAGAFQMIGYCHVIVAPMLDLAQRALPKNEWHIVNAKKHSIVMSDDGIILDIIGVRSDPADTVKLVQRDCLDAPHDIWPDVDEYIDDHLIADQPLGPAKPMPIARRLGSR
ncbi:MAG: hypothetical protein O7G84_01210 [Gammaproteobacteria bacterium]|nr:hypothetical protein [Gammaproteobacteria bacterium]